MFKKVSSSDNVSEFVIYKNNIAYRDVNSLFKKSIYLNGQFIYKHKVTGFQFDNNNLYFSTWKNESFAYNLHSCQLEKLEYDQIFVYKLDNRILFSKNEANYIKLDEDRNFIEINKKVPIFNNFLLGVIYITTSDNGTEFGRYDLNSAHKFWTFALSSLSTQETSNKEVKSPEVQQFIGAYQDRLYVLIDTR